MTATPHHMGVYDLRYIRPNLKFLIEFFARRETAGPGSTQAPMTFESPAA